MCKQADTWYTFPHPLTTARPPRAQKDMCDRRAYRPSFVVTMATIVNGDTVKPMP